jgi:hypothetical protein
MVPPEPALLVSNLQRSPSGCSIVRGARLSMISEARRHCVELRLCEGFARSRAARQPD